MNLLSLVGPRLDNICQIKRKCYYSSSSFLLQSKRALGIAWAINYSIIPTVANRIASVVSFSTLQSPQESEKKKIVLPPLPHSSQNRRSRSDPRLEASGSVTGADGAAPLQVPREVHCSQGTAGTPACSSSRFYGQPAVALTLQLLFHGSIHRRAAEAEAAGRGAGAEAGGGAQRALRWYKSRPNLSPGRTRFGRGYGRREGFGRSLFFFPCFDFFLLF
jgi:hypothetical protein